MLAVYCLDMVGSGRQLVDSLRQGGSLSNIREARIMLFMLLFMAGQAPERSEMALVRCWNRITPVIFKPGFGVDDDLFFS